jgi:hypothetical protein
MDLLSRFEFNRHEAMTHIRAGPDVQNQLVGCE